MLSPAPRKFARCSVQQTCVLQLGPMKCRDDLLDLNAASKGNVEPSSPCAMLHGGDAEFFEFILGFFFFFAGTFTPARLSSMQGPLGTLRQATPRQAAVVPSQGHMASAGASARISTTRPPQCRVANRALDCHR